MGLGLPAHSCSIHNVGSLYSYRQGNIVESSHIIIEDGKITTISQSEPPFRDSFDLVLDAKGKLLLPGLIDAHIHVSMIGESSYFVDLSTCESIESLQSILAQKKEAFPDLPWIIGINWQQDLIGRFPNRQNIDVVIEDTPVFLWRACWHIGQFLFI